MMNRRELLLGLGATTAGVAALPAFGGATLDLDDRSDFLTACVKMRGSLDDRLSLGWVTGKRYVVVEHEAVPMMGMVAATLTRYRRTSAEEFAVRSLEVAYFTDFNSGELLETWENPVTGKVVDVPRTRMGPSSLTVTADGLDVKTPVGEARGFKLNHRFEPAFVRGDDVWINEVIGVNGEARPGQRPFVYNEMTTYQARMSDLADPGQQMVPTNVSFHGLVTYRPWMGFGDTPGHTMAHGAGTRATRIEDLPAYWIELTERFHPDVLEDPLGALEKAAGEA
jgi:hypothetical protein